MATNPFDYAERFNRRGPTPEADNLDPVGAEIRRMREEEVRSTFEVAPPPDQVARATRLSREADVPPVMVEGSEDGVERTLQTRRFLDVANRYPAIGKFALSNPRGAAAAQDDAKSLGFLGEAFDGITNQVRRQADERATDARRNEGFFDRFGSLWSSGTANLEGGLFTVGAALQEYFAQFDDGETRRRTLGKARQLRERARASFASPKVAGSSSWDDVKTNPWSVGRFVVDQAAQSLPYMIGAAINPVAVAVSQSGTIGQERADNNRTGDASLGDVVKAAPAAALSTYLDRLGVEALFSGVGRSALSRALIVGSVEAGTEATQEAIEYAGGSVGTAVGFDPMRAAEMMIAGAIAGGGMGAGLRGAGEATDYSARKAAEYIRRSSDIVQARRERQFIDKAEKAATESKLRQRDPEAFRALLKEQAEDAGARNVFIPAEAIRAYQQSDSYDADMDPFDQGGFEEAMAAGGDYVMPIEDALTDLVGTPAWEAIKDDLRLTGGGMSAREAQTFEEAMDDVLADMGDKAAAQERADAPRRDQRERLIDHFTTQFGESYTAPVARKFAEVMVQRAMTRAERMGIDLEDALAGVSVKQVLPEGVAQAVKADAIDLVVNAMRQGKDAEVPVGESLLEFIRSRGGINDTGGDLQAMGLPKRFLRETDRDMLEIGSGDYGADTILQSAIESGFFPDLANVANEAGPSNLDPQVLLDAIEQELAGSPVYRETRTDPYRQAGEELRGILSDAGLDPDTASDREIRDALARFDAQEDGGRSLEQADSVDSEAFKAWFGASKVVDAEGKPLVVYHGTASEFDSFSKDAEAKHIELPGFFFTPDAGIAQRFSESASRKPFRDADGYIEGFEGAQIIPVYLSVQNPAEINLDDAAAGRMSGHQQVRALLEQAQRDGHDGAVIRGWQDGSGDVQWVAFSPTQIKSINNRGTFDPADPRILYQPAYHGSPHIFDQFSLSAIGTGEGAQAYGWGLYFAGRKEIAEHYKSELSRRKATVKWDGREISWTGLENLMTDAAASAARVSPRDDIRFGNGGIISPGYIGSEVKTALQSGQSIEELREEAKRSSYPENVTAAYRAAIEVAAEAEITATSGRLYEVEIPEDDEYLLWDKPLSDQPEKVREAFAGVLNTRRGLPEDFAETRPLGQVYRTLNGAGAKPGENAFMSAREVSLALHEAGIAGIKYLDGNSRSDGDGSYNYVVFDDSRVSIRAYEQEARGRIVFDGPKRTIELFQSRNLSTALHEMSHMWLEELMLDASLPNAPEQMKADAETVKAYFAANGHAMESNIIPTEAHELWARSGERYFMEGKAPSPALVRLFESFRAWLIGIYKTVDRLRAPITPEIREVFDRLIATDEEIAAAQERQALGQLFKDAATIGMSEAEFTAYQQQVDDARAGAHASLIDKTMRAVRRRETERYRKARKTVVAEEIERIDASPLYRAIAMMRETRVSKEWIEDTLGMDAPGFLPVRVPPLYVERGADPQVIAELAGYSTARDMIEALIGAEKAHRQAKEGGDKRSMRQRAIDTAADAEMLRRYGDPLNDGSIEREALAAVHSEMQGEVIASELRVLARRTGNRPTPYRIARDWARAKVRQGIVADEASAGAIQRYARNAAKAGRAAEEAMLKQDAGEAFRQKQFQMMNNALVAEAKAAADEVDVAVRRMDKIARVRTRKSVDQDYLEQAQALLEAVDLRRRSQVSIDRRGSWEAWAEARQVEGIDVVTPKSFEAQLGATNWTRLSVETLLTLDEQVKQIMHLGRMKQTLLDNAERRAFEEVVAEAEAAGDNIGRKPPKGSFVDPSWWESTKAALHAFDAGLLRMEQVFDWLDLGKSDGVFNRIVFRPIAEAQSRQRTMLEGYHVKLKAAAAKLDEKTVRSWADKVTLELIDPETGLPATFQRKRVIAMALNWGNAGNRQRLVDGYGWNDAAVDRALMDNLTEAEWGYVQEVWDTIGELWPDIAKMERAINGVAPPKVDPVEIVTPFGTFAGGYYPAIYDSTLDYTAEERQAAKSDLFSANYIRATTRASATKDRAEAVSRPILLDLGVINRHLGEVIHDVTHRAPVMQAHKFLNDRRVKRMIDETLGPEIRKQMQPWLNYVANSWAAERAGNEGIGRFMGKLRANTTVVGMGWRFTTMLTQIAGYSNSFEKVGVSWVAPQIAKFQAQMAGSVGKLATFQGVQMPEMMAFALERSDELRFRLDTLDRDIRLEMDRLQSRGGKVKEGLTAARRFAFHGIGYMDRLVSIPTWTGAYNKAVASGLDDKAAAYEADKAIRLSQGAGSPKDLAAVSRGTGRWGEAFKLLTMFYTYVSSVYSRQRTLGRDVRRAGAKDIPALMARAWWLIVVPPLLAEILSGRGPEEDEEWGWWAFQKMLSQSLGAIPIVRDLTDPVFDGFAGRPGFDYRLSPLTSVGASVVNVSKDVGKIADGDETKRATRNALEAVGYTTGLVPGQIAASAQFLVDVGAGDAEPENLSDWYQGLSKGRLAED